jgi:MFS family permease
MALSSILIFLVPSINAKIAFLMMSYLGAACIEPMKEARFYRLLNRREEEKFYGVFKTHEKMGYMIGPFLASFMLVFINDLNSVFLLFGVIMAFFLWIAFTLKGKLLSRHRRHSTK